MAGYRYQGVDGIRASDAKHIWNKGETVSTEIRGQTTHVVKVHKGTLYHCIRYEDKRLLVYRHGSA